MERVVASRASSYGAASDVEYLVKWRLMPYDEASWEEEADVNDDEAVRASPTSPTSPTCAGSSARWADDGGRFSQQVRAFHARNTRPADPRHLRALRKGRQKGTDPSTGKPIVWSKQKESPPCVEMRSPR